MCAVDARASATCYLVFCTLCIHVVLVTLYPNHCVLRSMDMTTLDITSCMHFILASLQLLFPSIITLEFNVLLCLTVSYPGC